VGRCYKSLQTVQEFSELAKAYVAYSLPVQDDCGRINCNDSKKYAASALIDSDGFRSNVGIILCNSDRLLFWGRRVGQDAWQFPQGGIKPRESPQEAMFRELQEEVGLESDQVELLGATRDWLKYRLPERYIRRNCEPLCVGQKQIWFLLRVLCGEEAFCLDHTEAPEFEDWRWVKYWQPVREVIYFKRQVYTRALEELAPLLYPEGTPTRCQANYLRQNRR
jgi:putative (di)nucleoside polyphosphate hydrolase